MKRVAILASTNGTILPDILGFDYSCSASPLAGETERGIASNSKTEEGNNSHTPSSHVLDSDRGSPCEGEGSVQFPLFLTDKENCIAAQKAEQMGIETVWINPQGKKREAWDAQAVEILQAANIDLIILVGFMRILSPIFVDAFAGKILNIHPSLLPKFAGGMNMDVHQAVLDAGEIKTGATVHFVTNDLDAGEIIIQKSVSVIPTDTAESLKNKVQKIEGEMYPQAILKTLFL